MDLNGKVALITGASMGIGAACARAFARRGCRLLLTARSAGALDEICRSVAPVSATALPADLSRPDAAGELADRALAVYRRVDVLVNNAGVGMYLSCWEADPALVRHLMEVNWFAPQELIRRLVPAMRGNGGGMVVNVSSVAGKVALPWLTAYSASKAALNALSDGLRMELAGTGVGVLLVCPGFVNTGFPERVLAGRIPEAVARRRPFAITAEQCAEAIVEGVEKDKRTVVTPRAAWLLVGASRLAPRLVHASLARMRGA